MNLSYRSEAVRQWWSPDGHVGQAFDHPVQFKSAVEPIGERAEVATQMFTVERMIGPVDRILDVAEHGIDPGKLRFLDTRRAAARCNTAMRANRSDQEEFYPLLFAKPINEPGWSV